MSAITFYLKLSLSKKIYIATAMGMLIGIFYGDLCADLEPFNNIFIRVFQITIIPYMVFTILQSIGSLNEETAKIIGKKGGIILLLLWGVSIFYALCLKVSLPDIHRAKFYRPDDFTAKSSFDLFDLFIPTNPFHSFANGYIPAIVIFSILVGVAIMYDRKKASLIEYSRIMALLMKRVNDYIVTLLPVGVLVMSSFTFGTINLAHFKGMLLYVLASLIYLIFMSMVFLPGITISMTDLTYRNFLTYSIPAALIAFTTGSVFLSLPVIYDSMNKYEKDQKRSNLLTGPKERKHNLVSIIVPLAWIVPASYKFLVIFFIVFSCWYYGRTMDFITELSAYIGGIPCLFGSNSVIVPFLIDITNLSSNAYNLFMLTSSFMVYFNNANGAIFIVVCTILCYASINGRLKIRWSKLFGITAIGMFVFIAFLYGLCLIMGEFMSVNEDAKEELTHMNLHSYNKYFYSQIDASYLTLDQYKERPSLYEGEPLLNIIARTKVMRVGYIPEAPPFSFFNHQGELVGFDIDTVYDLAEELDCDSIEFYAIDNIEEYQQALIAGKKIDMYVGGHMYRGPMLDNIRTSEAYMILHAALLIPSKDKNKFTDFSSILNDKNITIGYLAGGGKSSGKNVKEIVKKSEELVPLSKFSDYFKLHKTYALLTSAEIASAINILYHGYWMFEYKGEDLKLYYAYMLSAAPNADTFREFVNEWIRIQIRSGENGMRYNYWIMGQAKIHTAPRWSVLRWLQKNQYFIVPEKPEDLYLIND